MSPLSTKFIASPCYNVHSLLFLSSNGFYGFYKAAFYTFTRSRDQIVSTARQILAMSSHSLISYEIELTSSLVRHFSETDALYLSWETRWCALWHSCLGGKLPTLQPGNSWERWEVTMKGRTKVSLLEQPALSVKRPGHASQRRNWGGICRLRNPTWSLRTTWRNFQPLTPLTPWGISSQ